ncbi:Glutamate receptor U1-like 9 [Homarus americanus]|uniref:Glutamate receptor U1-like 9 n=1 Tax=Homarus americanus TaxID=6706 RepID=A0A8J5TF58_HOMAM|nr:Glutamate receptor U1-like 9 [Homarus americanus]
MAYKWWLWQVGIMILITTTHQDEVVADSVEQPWQTVAEEGASLNRTLKFRFPRAPHLRVAAESWPPHVQVEAVSETTVDHERHRGLTVVRGPMADFLRELAASLNFTYSIVQGDGYWGAPDSNGTWNGMIGMVLRKEVDFGLGPFGLSHQRSQVVDFTMPILRELLHVLVTRPRPQADPWGFLSPFTWKVWVGVLGSLLMVAATMTTLHLGAHGSSFTTHLWTCYQIFVSQILIMHLHHVAIGAGWMGEGVLLRLTFGALTSLLAVKAVPIKYDSLRDVLDDPSLTLLMEGSTALTGLLQKAEDGVYGELAVAVKQRGVRMRASQLQEAAYTHLPGGTHAMFLETPPQTPGGCLSSLQPLIDARIAPVTTCFVFLRILAVREFGLHAVWTRRQTPNISHCLKMPTKLKFQEPYSILHLWAVFLLAAAGMLLASLVFLCELFLYHYSFTSA